MIYTVTFNPAIDYVVHADHLQIGATNRAASEEYYFGGKGINVSTVLHRLGAETTALGFISGFTGEALARGLAEEGFNTDFIRLPDGFTRINVKIKGEKETELNGQGPVITEAACAELFARLEALTPQDTLVISGSVPSSMPEDTYEQILARTCDKDVRTVVDATGALLLNVLKYRPFLIKPNNDELAEMLHRPADTDEQIVEGARTLRAEGAQNVIVSRGAKGAVMVTEDDQVILQEPILGRTVNSVGAGDSMVAGFLAGYLRTSDYAYALKLGTAAGSATACSPGLATASEIERRMFQCK
ncbi:MAG: 1-phosphofructokinase [Eubacteriales bacterium]|nr:1-phosphofructokinase [Eubacteriales bacterium]